MNGTYFWSASSLEFIYFASENNNVYATIGFTLSVLHFHKLDYMQTNKILIKNILKRRTQGVSIYRCWKGSL